MELLKVKELHEEKVIGKLSMLMFHKDLKIYFKTKVVLKIITTSDNGTILSRK